MTDGTLDVGAVVGEIEAEARRRRDRGEISAKLLALVDRPFDVGVDVDAPEEFAVVQSARPLHSARNRLGPQVVRAKRVIRRLLAWYIQPITQDQTRFNLAILRELRDLEQRVRWVEPPLVGRTGEGEATDLVGHAHHLVEQLRGAQRLRVLGGYDRLLAALTSGGVADVATISWDDLAGAGLASLPALLFVDSPNRMTGAQVLAALPLAAAAVEAGGRVVVDVADPGSSPGRGGDVAALRSLTAESVSTLMTAAGFVDIEAAHNHGRVTVGGRRRNG